MLKLSPSILAADFAVLGEQLKKLESCNVEYIHFDVMDGMFVPNISFGIPVLKSVRKTVGTTLDVHLMIEEPIRYIDEFANAGADIITVHYEACTSLGDTIDKIHERGLKCGVSIRPGTDIDVLTPYLSHVDMILIMTVEPGFGGQTLMAHCVDKVKELRELLNSKNMKIDIEVDGGITRDNIETVLDAGANVIVMGSSVFNGDISDNVGYFKKVFGKY